MGNVDVTAPDRDLAPTTVTSQVMSFSDGGVTVNTACVH